MTSTTDAVMTVVSLTISGVLTMTAIALGAGRALRNAGQAVTDVLADAAAPELEEHSPAVTATPPADLKPRPRTYRLSETQTTIRTIRFKRAADGCTIPGCASCRIVKDTAGRLP